MNRFRDMATENYARRLTAVILNLVKPEVETFDPLTRSENPAINQTRTELHDPLQKRSHSTFSKMAAPAAILDFLKPQVASLDPPTAKTIYPRTKDEVDWMIRCRDTAVRSFPKCDRGRSVVGPQYYIVLMYSSSLR